MTDFLNDADLLCAAVLPMLPDLPDKSELRFRIRQYGPGSAWQWLCSCYPHLILPARRAARAVWPAESAILLGPAR